jgi:hypothetical protein
MIKPKRARSPSPRPKGPVNHFAWHLVRSKVLEFTVVLTAVASVLFATVGIWYGREDDLFISHLRPEARSEIARLSAEVQALRERMRALPTTATVPAATQAFENRVIQIERRQQALERIFTPNPMRSLELPLLRRDIEAVRDSNAQAMEAMRRSVEQVYDLSKWLIGAVLLGLLSLLASHFLPKRERKDA